MIKVRQLSVKSSEKVEKYHRKSKKVLDNRAAMWYIDYAAPLETGLKRKKTLILCKLTLDILSRVCYIIDIMREEVESMV